MENSVLQLSNKQALSSNSAKVILRSILYGGEELSAKENIGSRRWRGPNAVGEDFPCCNRELLEKVWLKF